MGAGRGGGRLERPWRKREQAGAGGAGGAAGLRASAPVQGGHGTFPVAGTAARSAGCRSRGWAITSRSRRDWLATSCGWAATRQAPVPQGVLVPGPGDGAAPGPPEAIGKGFCISQRVCLPRCCCTTEQVQQPGVSINPLVKGLSRQGAEVLGGPGWPGGAAAGAPARRSRTRSRSGRGARGTCAPARRPGGRSRRATGAARRSGPAVRCSSARTPPAS